MISRLVLPLTLACSVLSFNAPVIGNEAAADATTGPGLIPLWAAGQPAFGEYIRPEQSGVEAGAQAGLGYTVQTGRALAANPLPDFGFLSLEQQYDAQAIRAVVEGLRSEGPNRQLTLLVRIPPIAEDGPEAARTRVREALALGADGIVIPHVLSAEEARTAVSFFEGVDVWSADNPEGTVVAMLIIEDPPVFDELEEIIRLPGYSALVVGIGSLTSALGGDREAAEAINQRVLKRTQQAGLPNLTTVSAETVAERVQQGFLALLAYSDINQTIRVGRAAAGR